MRMVFGGCEQGWGWGDLQLRLRWLHFLEFSKGQMCPFHIRDVRGHFCAVPVHTLTVHNSPLQSAPCRSQGASFPSRFSHLQKPVLPKFPSLVRSLTHKTNKNMKKKSLPKKKKAWNTQQAWVYIYAHIKSLTITSLYELSSELGNEKWPLLGHRVLLWGEGNVLEPGKGSGCSPRQLY